MPYVLLLLLFVCLFGIFRPFRNIKRWQFGLAAFVCFLVIGVTAPDQRQNSPATGSVTENAVSPAQAAQLEKANATAIAALKREAAQVPASDVEGNLRIYKRLSELAPGNTAFSQKAALFEAKIKARKRYEDDPAEALTVKDFDWASGGFGSVMIIRKLTVSNDAPFPIKDFRLRCVHQGNSGTDMDSNTRTIFEIVPANSSKSIRNINMGFISSQVATSRCEIRSAVKA